MKFISGFIPCLLSISFSCKKLYTPPYIAAPGSYLVVEGVINPRGPTTIKLSKTVNLSSNSVVNPVVNATITIESDKGDSFLLAETGSGKYISDNLTLNYSEKYRLRIKTTGSHE